MIALMCIVVTYTVILAYVYLILLYLIIKKTISLIDWITEQVFYYDLMHYWWTSNAVSRCFVIYIHSALLTENVSAKGQDLQIWHQIIGKFLLSVFAYLYFGKKVGRFTVVCFWILDFVLH